MATMWNIETRFSRPANPRVYKDRPKVLPTQAGLLIGMVPCVVGSAFWSRRGFGGSAWLILTILLVSVPLLAVLIWNANPLEIERHASQIGVQLRLSAWLAGIFLVDWLLHRKLSS
jgi:hypothetical protein